MIQSSWDKIFKTDEKQPTLYQKQREYNTSTTQIKTSDQCLHSFRSDIFSPEDINKIIEVGDSLTLQEARAIGPRGESKADHKTNPSIRRGRIGWIIPPKHIPSLIPNIIKIWGGKYKHFQAIQYGVYKIGDHYTWHMETIKAPMTTTTTKRVSAAVVQLSDPSDYGGGVLEIDNGKEIISVEKKQGLVTIIPIDVLHRVTKVTSGIRKTLVIWALGDQYN